LNFESGQIIQERRMISVF